MPRFLLVIFFYKVPGLKIEPICDDITCFLKKFFPGTTPSRRSSCARSRWVTSEVQKGSVRYWTSAVQVFVMRFPNPTSDTAMRVQTPLLRVVRFQTQLLSFTSTLRLSRLRRNISNRATLPWVENKRPKKYHRSPERNSISAQISHAECIPQHAEFNA